MPPRIFSVFRNVQAITQQNYDFQAKVIKQHCSYCEH